MCLLKRCLIHTFFCKSVTHRGLHFTYHCLSLSLQMSLVLLHGLNLGQSFPVFPVHKVVTTLTHILQAPICHNAAAACRSDKVTLHTYVPDRPTANHRREKHLPKSPWTLLEPIDQQETDLRYGILLTNHHTNT